MSYAGSRRVLVLAVLTVFGAGRADASHGRKADLRTPKPSATPRINGPKIYGERPGHPFLYRIPSTGHSADGLFGERSPGVTEVGQQVRNHIRAGPSHSRRVYRDIEGFE